MNVRQQQPHKYKHQEDNLVTGPSDQSVVADSAWTKNPPVFSWYKNMQPFKKKIPLLVFTWPSV